MDDHCKGCRYLWTRRADKRAWCCKIGMYAKRSVGHCKLMGFKERADG